MQKKTVNSFLKSDSPDDYVYQANYKKYSDSWSPLSRAVYRACYRWGYFMDRNKWLMYLLNITWGAITFIISLLITLALLLTGHKPQKFNGLYCFKVGSYWGGFEMGLMFVRDKTSSDHVSAHEFGHGFAQTSLFGPFMLPLISIPSMIRYWARELKISKSTTPYDSIWFEASASDSGSDIIYDRKHAQLQKNKKENEAL